MLPEGPEDEGSLVLLDRQLLSAISVPGQPARGQRPVRVVLVEKIPFWGQRPGAELEELPGQVDVAGKCQSTGDQRPIARPDVAVGVADVPGDIGVVGGNYASGVVHLGPDDEQAEFVLVADLVRQFLQVGQMGPQPELPVARGTAQETLRSALADEPIGPGDRLEVPSDSEPVVQGLAATRGQLEAEARHRVHRALSHRVAREFPVLGVPPGALSPRKLLIAACPVVDPDQQSGKGIPCCRPGWASLASHRYRAIGEEPTARLVVEQGSALGFVIGGVAHLATQDVKVVMEEHSDVPRAHRLVRDAAAADKKRLVEVDRVGELQGECEARVAEPDVGDERLSVEAEVAVPAGVAEPAELALRPDANAKRMSQGMVLLAERGANRDRVSGRSGRS